MPRCRDCKLYDLGAVLSKSGGVMADFRIRVRVKPGSLLDDGCVVSHTGIRTWVGPCFIPDDISPARKGLLGEAGWCKTPAADWPSLPPGPGLTCIYRPTRKD